MIEVNVTKYEQVLIVIGKNIRHFRILNNLSQIELGLNADVSPSYITDIEKGKKNVTVETIAKIALALNVKPYELFVDDRKVYFDKTRVDSKE